MSFLHLSFWVQYLFLPILHTLCYTLESDSTHCFMSIWYHVLAGTCYGTKTIPFFEKALRSVSVKICTYSVCGTWILVHMLLWLFQNNLIVPLRMWLRLGIHRLQHFSLVTSTTCSMSTCIPYSWCNCRHDFYCIIE